MVASSDQCRRHIAGATSAVASFSDDGVVQAVLKELRGVGEDRHTGTRPPLVGLEHRIVLTNLLRVPLSRLSLKKLIYGRVIAAGATWLWGLVGTPTPFNWYTDWYPGVNTARAEYACRTIQVTWAAFCPVIVCH